MASVDPCIEGEEPRLESSLFRRWLDRRRLDLLRHGSDEGEEADVHPERGPLHELLRT